jgi:hypothetical protein
VYTVNGEAVDPSDAAQLMSAVVTGGDTLAITGFNLAPSPFLQCVAPAPLPLDAGRPKATQFAFYDARGTESTFSKWYTLGLCCSPIQKQKCRASRSS